MDGMAGVVINKPGSSGLIGAKIVKDAKSDAYTLYAINIGTFTVADIAQTVTKGQSPVGPRDFRPLGCFSQLITGMQVHTSDPANNAKEWADAPTFEEVHLQISKMLAGFQNVGLKFQKKT